MKRIILFLFIIYCSCNEKVVSDDQLDYVGLNTWVWDKGFKIGVGDFVSFAGDSSIFALRNDTIYYKRIPKAIIEKVIRKYNELIVVSIDKRESGV